MRLWRCGETRLTRLYGLWGSGERLLLGLLLRRVGRQGGLRGKLLGLRTGLPLLRERRRLGGRRRLGL